MNKFHSMITVLMLVISTLSAAAQDAYVVKGVIQDQIGPVIGATVMEQGTTNGASTGLDGDYTIAVSGPDAMLEFSCIGYKTQIFKASEVPATVMLEEDTFFLDDVVVIGYGTVKKEDMTGSIVAIKTEELNRGAVVSTQDMLKGKVPGLQIIPVILIIVYLVFYYGVVSLYGRSFVPSKYDLPGYGLSLAFFLIGIITCAVAMYA